MLRQRYCGGGGNRGLRAWYYVINHLNFAVSYNMDLCKRTTSIPIFIPTDIRRSRCSSSPFKLSSLAPPSLSSQGLQQPVLSSIHMYAQPEAWSSDSRWKLIRFMPRRAGVPALRYSKIQYFHVFIAFEDFSTKKFPRCPTWGVVHLRSKSWNCFQNREKTRLRLWKFHEGARVWKIFRDFNLHCGANFSTSVRKYY